jgi:uncharacterized protein
MKVAEELFVIPPNNGAGNFVLYLPLRDTILEVDAVAISQLQRFSRDASFLELMSPDLRGKFEKVGVMVEDIEADRKRIPPAPSLRAYKPTHVTLLPSYGCNLCCEYCYSRGGEDLTPPMTFDMSKAAIDTIVRNAKEIGTKKVQLGFHGGGEPFIRGNISLIRQSVEYFKEQANLNGLKGAVSSATNAVMPRETLEYVVNNFDSLNISLDGPADIQNVQRPLAGGGPSFDQVLETIAVLRERDFPFGIRATVTERSVHRIDEIVQMCYEIAPKVRVHLEPLFECGRCRTSKIHAPNPEVFLHEYLKAEALARKLGNSTYYSGGRLGSLSQSFCGASGTNFFITPQGDVTNCLEVTRREEPKADVYIIGEYNPMSGNYEIDESKREVLCGRVVTNISHCANCFAKYNCGGDCPSKVFNMTGSSMDTAGNGRCVINRGVLLSQIREKLINAASHEAEGAQNGL